MKERYMEFLDLKKQYKSIEPEIDSAIKGVLEKGVFIGGEEVDRFEKDLARFSGTRFTVSVNSGTDALFLSLKALGICRGDEVITSPFTFVAAAEAIANAGARPVFADIDPATFNIDPEEIKKKISKKTKVILPVHIFGKLVEMDEVNQIAEKRNLFVIEDAAQAIGAELSGRRAGSFGDLGCFSFFPSKNLGAFGDGGAVITNNENYSEKIKLLKNHGSSKKEKYLNLELGINSRMDSLQAAILRVKLKHLDDWNLKRLENSKVYFAELENLKEVVLPDLKNSVINQFTIRAEKRDALKKFLEENNISSAVYYPLPLHLQPVFKYLGYAQGDFKNAEKASREVMSLPIFPGLQEWEIKEICHAIKQFYGKVRI